MGGAAASAGGGLVGGPDRKSGRYRISGRGADEKSRWKRGLLRTKGSREITGSPCHPRIRRGWAKARANFVDLFPRDERCSLCYRCSGCSFPLRCQRRACSGVQRLVSRGALRAVGLVRGERAAHVDRLARAFWLPFAGRWGIVNCMHPPSTSATTPVRRPGEQLSLFVSRMSHTVDT